MQEVLQRFIDKPPQLASSIGIFIREIAPHLIVVNEALEDMDVVDRNHNLLHTICLSLPVILDVMITNFKQLMDYHSMNTTGPCNGVMGLFFIMSYLIVIIEDRVDVPLRKPWQIMTPAKNIGNLMQYKLVTSEKPIKSYTKDDLNKAMNVLAVYWYYLDHEIVGLEEYLLGLLHRLCLISTCVDDDIEVISTCRDKIPRDAKEIESTVFRIVTSRSRQVVTIARMLWLLRLAAKMEKVPEKGDEADKKCIALIREYTMETVKVLSKTREAKSEIREVFPRLAQLHGDVEMFVNNRGMENARPASLIMSVRPESQQAISQMHQFVILELIAAKMKDEEPDYFDKFTRYEHIYALLLKTYVMNMALKDHNVDFFKDYIIYEMNLPFFYDRIANSREPVVIQLFSKLHVYFEGKLHVCSCIEMAIVTWLRIVLYRLHGRLNRQDLSNTLKHLLGITPAGNTQQSILVANSIINRGDIIID